MSDTEHECELTSTSNEVLVQPGSMQPDPPLSDHEERIYQATQLELDLEFD